MIGARELEDPEAVVRNFCGEAAEDKTDHIARGVSEFVPIMRGCNNYCAYCIVPYVRGPEQSIAAAGLVRVIKQRVEPASGRSRSWGRTSTRTTTMALTLPNFSDSSPRSMGWSASASPRRTPRTAPEKLIRHSGTPKVCRHIHLPVQSGSDRILALMNRRYTAEHYLSLVAMIRKHIPDTDITTDLLVGFPSETNKDFAATMSLVEQVRFTSAFMFAYSVRAGTRAATLDDDVPRAEKLERLKRLIALQNSITREFYDGMVGRDLDVMLYGPLEKGDRSFLRAQDFGSKRVLLPCTAVKAGTILRVRAVRSSGMTLIAE